MGMEFHSGDLKVLTKNWSVFTYFTVRILSLRPIVISTSPKSSLNFGLDSLGSLSHFTKFSTTSVKFFLDYTS